MTNELNKFLKEFKTIIETGYTKNGRQFLGTGPTGVFNVIHFDGVTSLAFDVRLKKPSRDDMTLSPIIAIHQITPDTNDFIGSNKDSYVFSIEMFFTSEQKIVDAVRISEEELARYFLGEMNAAISNCKDQFVTSRVMSLNRLPGITQDGKHNDTNIYGFTARASVSLG